MYPEINNDTKMYKNGLIKYAYFKSWIFIKKNDKLKIIFFWFPLSMIKVSRVDDNGQNVSLAM